MTIPWANLVTVLCCLAGAAFFSGMETGVISIHRFRLRHLVHQGRREAKLLMRFLEHPDHLLGTTLLGTNICTVMASVVGTSAATIMLGVWGPAVSSIFITLTLLIFSEYVPKAWFRSKPAARTMPFAPILHLCGVVLYPLSRILTGITRVLLPIRQPQTGGGVSGLITREDLQYLAREGEQTGALSTRERRMIHGVFELTHRRCEEIMVPRKNMILVHSEANSASIMQIARQHGLNRLPVYHDQQDNIAGIVYVMDIAADPTAETKKAQDYMRAPQYVPADTPADELLPRMRLSRQPMFLVTDEQDDVIGLLTLNDVLKQIIGDI